ncbi:MAG: hypothetical protein JJU11_05280 [Candidatus Sumerlaeia bacterium]|nr:hypothetical protein [Candidatus Sumerlaeia bacterium]
MRRSFQFGLAGWRLLALAMVLGLVVATPTLLPGEDTGEETAEVAVEEEEETSPNAVETAMVTTSDPPKEERPIASAVATLPTIEGQDDSDLEEATPEVQPLSFRPPLSLNECLQLIDTMVNTLPNTNSEDGPLDSVPSASLIRMIDVLYSYLNFRDDLHTSLAHYEWMRLGETRVADPGDTADRDSLHFDAPVRNISALSLAVDRGDVYLHGLWVYDESGQERQQFLFDPPLRLRHSLPRMEVFHLWRRTEISRIEMKYSRAEDMDRSPKVFVRGGVTNRREFIKTALYNLKKEAEPAIHQGRYADARIHLQSARGNITDYIRQNRRGQ